MPRLSVIALAVCAVPAGAQPFSQSMAQCAGISQLLSDWVQDPTAAEVANYRAAVWFNAAIVQAEGEGIGDAAAHVHQIKQATYAEWEGRGKAMVFSEDFKDWASYCRSFGDHLGLQLRP